MDNQTTFAWGDVTVTVRRAIVRDRLERRIILDKLMELSGDDPLGDQLTWELYIEFARTLSQVSTSKPVPWHCPIAEPAPVLWESYQAFLEQDATLYDRLMESFALVAASYNEPHLQPNGATQDQKKDTSE